MSGLPSLPGAGARIPGSARRAPVLPTTTPGLPDQAVVDIIPSDTSLTLSVGRQSMDLGLGPDLLAGILPDTASLDGLRLRSRAFGPLTISGLAARMDDVTNSGLHPETEALLYGGEARLAPPDVPATLSFLWYRQRLGADAAGKLQAPGGSASSGIAANTYGLSTRLALDRDVTLASSALLQRGRADDEALSAYAFAAGVAVTPPLPLVDSMELGFATFSGGDDDGGEITAFQPLLAGDSAVGAMDGFLAASNLSVLRSAVTFQGPGNLTLTTEFMQYLAAGQGDVYAADGAALASPDDGLLGRELRLSLALPLEQDLTLDGSARVFAPAPDLADEVDMGDAPGVSLMFGLHMNM
ncbi:hypothetical protein [Desulfovibrio sp. X2]|uniref:hypothetical protein n=1 Tax=Desulfovibrio sp. X2 TaxID=941449 RepID=UPI0005503665|nr:hypothetical protein [Desulfovibrio sp. X2]